MNNYGFENRNYNRRSYSASAWIAAILSVLYDMTFGNARFVAGVKMTLAIAGVALFFGFFGGVESGMISAAIGFSVCAALVLFGIIFFGEK